MFLGQEKAKGFLALPLQIFTSKGPHECILLFGPHLPIVSVCGKILFKILLVQEERTLPQ